MSKFKNALVSVSDKTGLVEALRPLQAQGLRIVSTGGTARLLRESGFNVVDVSEQTKFPEVMDGRVKTLHPNIHMALLARVDHQGDERILQDHGLEPFDLVIVNLYPFEQHLNRKSHLDELIENIDIGGPTLLRASAKNFSRVTTIVDPADYALLAEGVPSLEKRQELAAKVFAHVSSYDAMISHSLAPNSAFPQFPLGGHQVQALRYGENPHQKAYWYRRRGAQVGWQEAKVLQGKELSFNNLLDLESAVQLLRELEGPSAVAVKHNNPCGAASARTLAEALERCLKADPVSVFGGILALNQTVDESCVDLLNSLFLECVVAPHFTEGARVGVAKKKNLRLLEWPDLGLRDDFWKVHTIQGGFLVQQTESIHHWSNDWKILGEHPTPDIRADLSFAWVVAAHLKSNAIAIAGGQQTLGLGMGQVNRIDAIEHAIDRMQRFHPNLTSTPVLASDAFFPFTDAIEKISAAGIRWVIQPGGSIRDEEVFAAAKEKGINMVLTGRRHFRH